MMSDKNRGQDVSEFLDHLTEFLTSTPERTMDELKEELRAEGIDPEAVIKKTHQLVDKKIEEFVDSWQEKAQRERIAAQKRIESVKTKAFLSPEQVREKIFTFFGGELSSKQQEYAHAYFRKLEKITEKDLRTLLEDLERLKYLDGEV